MADYNSKFTGLSVDIATRKGQLLPELTSQEYGSIQTATWPLTENGNVLKAQNGQLVWTDTVPNATNATNTSFTNNSYSHYSIDVSTLEPVEIPLTAGKTYHVRVYMEFVTMQTPAEVQNTVYIPSMSGNNLYIYIGEFTKDVMLIRSITAFLYSYNQGAAWKLNLALGQPEGQSSQAYPSKIDIYVKEIK